MEPGDSFKEESSCSQSNMGIGRSLVTLGDVKGHLVGLSPLFTCQAIVISRSHGGEN